MIARLILIRHGQTDWNATGRWQGQADPPLNALGRAQAENAARELADRRIDALISSDLRRARETADIIAARLGLNVQLEPRLREINLGDWQGLYTDEIERRWPHDKQQWHDAPLSVRPPHGETIEELAARVITAADAIARRYANRTVGIVAHELPIAVIITRTAGLPLARLRDHVPANAAWREVAWTV